MTASNLHSKSPTGIISNLLTTKGIQTTLKNNNQDFNLTWSIAKRAISYTGGSKRYILCLEERLLKLTLCAV